MDKIKIALLSNGYGKVSRGAEQFTFQFYNQLKEFFNMDIFGMEPTDHSLGLRTKFRDDFILPWRNGRAYLEGYYFGKAWYKQYLDYKKYDVIYNNAGFGGSYWSKKYRKKTDTPFITRARGGGRFEETLQCSFHPNMMEFHTEWNQKRVTKNIKVNSYVVPSAIELDDFKNRPKGKCILIEDLERPVFLGTSAFVAFKRNDLIIKAVSKLDEGSLLFVGGGQLKDKTIKLGEELLGERFKYGGVIPYSKRDEIIKLYHDCDVFVQASKSECFGHVFLEAMATNTPVVTQNDARRREIIGQGGLLVDCSNIEDFSKVLKETLHKDWSKNPYKQAEKYDWKNVRKQYVEMFKITLEGK
jgi:glycosyltransferase involved in cell wall biosynthesis